VDKVEKLIEEQERKLRLKNIDHSLSYLSYVGMVTTAKTFSFYIAVAVVNVALNFTRIFSGVGKTKTHVHNCLYA
jgi:hypothetical protein